MRLKQGKPVYFSLSFIQRRRTTSAIFQMELAFRRVYFFRVNTHLNPRPEGILPLSEINKGKRRTLPVIFLCQRKVDCIEKLRIRSSVFLYSLCYTRRNEARMTKLFPEITSWGWEASMGTSLGYKPFPAIGNGNWIEACKIRNPGRALFRILRDETTAAQLQAQSRECF